MNNTDDLLVIVASLAAPDDPCIVVGCRLDYGHEGQHSFSVYTRSIHAAHYAYSDKSGHDLERWDAPQAWKDPKPADVPDDTVRSHGYLDKDGKEHVVFTRIAPMTPGTCAYCAKKPPGSL